MSMQANVGPSIHLNLTSFLCPYLPSVNLGFSGSFCLILYPLEYRLCVGRSTKYRAVSCMNEGAGGQVQNGVIDTQM